MRISERADNAIRAMAELAAAGESSVVKADHIAARQEISPTYLLDILRELRLAGLLRSKRGPEGGWTLARPAADISLAEVLRAVDGPLADVHDESLRSLAYPAPAESLPVVWMAVRGSLRRVFERVSVADLVAGDLPDDVVVLAEEYQRAVAEQFGERAGGAAT